ncbi:protein of unknown function [Marinobacter gudaonensis]|uniref:DUF4123 domain-containing protein n=1 Tax=Marinobacter gudaonensis TaxID=375760 RepID=A0A1I6H008_9GAMM|nr:DUF4123 domain-containing protein [Marinobacter gudaonensis]SFR47786.1 protein of unknown function [Marinobacter gudaonensis]
MLLTAPAMDKSKSLLGLDQTLRDFRVASGEQCLLIIDAARYDKVDTTQQIYTLDGNPDWFWLFDGTPFEQHKDAGPIVVRTSVNSELFQCAVSRWGADEALAILVSKYEPSKALAGIRKSLVIHFETYGPCFVRPYDGRFLEVVNTCLPEAVGSLIREDDLLVWCTCHSEGMYWSGASGVGTEGEGFYAHQPRSLERLLTWVSGWPRCMAITNKHRHPTSHRIRIIRELWSAGHPCPESDAELGALWQHAELEFHGPHEKGL